MTLTTKQMPCRYKNVPYGDNEAILKAFEEDGYVVVTDVFPDAQVHDMLGEIWTSPRLLGAFDREDSSTWEDPSWPQQAGGRNFLQSSDVFLDTASWEIQSNPRMLHVQQLLYGRRDIVMSGLGRWGVMRPSALHPEWRTDSSWLHWDQNPWKEPGFCRVQTIVCLTDSTPTSGGFVCVPGFQKEFREWGEKHPMGSVEVNGKVLDESYGDGQPFPLPLDDPCQKDVVRVMAPAGSMVLWDSRLPHQNFPNTDKSAFRVVHYTNMVVPTQELAEGRRSLLNKKRVLMDVLGLEGPRFPHKLSPVARQLHCLPSTNAPLEEVLEAFGVEDVYGFRRAVELVQQAGKAEESGDISLAIQKHRSAMFAFPDIEDWHEAIFS